MPIPEKLLVIGMGGSFDGEVGEDDDVVPRKKSCLPDYFKKKRIRLPYPIEVRVICVKFSPRVTKNDRKKTATTIISSTASHILITSGTGVMAALQDYLMENLPREVLEKKVVLIAASRKPLVDVTPSDGPVQFGIALGTLPSLEPGVYTIYDGVVE